MLGGGPVEIGSGVGGLAYSWILGRRQEKELLNFRPHNVSLVGLGSMSSPIALCSELTALQLLFSGLDGLVSMVEAHLVPTSVL